MDKIFKEFREIVSYEIKRIGLTRPFIKLVLVHIINLELSSFLTLV